MTAEARNLDANLPENKANDKEYNFRALESKFERTIAQERAEKEQILRELDELRKSKAARQEEEDDSEPYVDNKKLEKKLKSFEKDLDEKIDRKAEEKAQRLIEKRDQEMWLNSNPDFFDVVQSHAQRFFEKTPHLADAILKMPDNFERKKLVYHNIKSLGLDRPEQKIPSIQEKIDANRRSPYYQPTGMANAPYAAAGDFSETGQKRAYDELQKLKANLRLGG